MTDTRRNAPLAGSGGCAMSAEIREALEPFARRADAIDAASRAAWGGLFPDCYSPGFSDPEIAKREHAPTMGDLRRARTAFEAIPSEGTVKVRALDVDGLAQEIRRVDGRNGLGAGELAEALIPYLSACLAPTLSGEAEAVPCSSCDGTGVDLWKGIHDRDCSVCHGRGTVAAKEAEAEAVPVGEVVAWDFQPDLANDPEFGKEPSLREIVRDHYARELGETEGGVVTDFYIREHLAVRPAKEPGEVERKLRERLEKVEAAAREARDKLSSDHGSADGDTTVESFWSDSDALSICRQIEAALTGDAQEGGR